MPRSTSRTAITWLACALAGLGLVACGGGGSSDEDQIRSAIEQGLTTADPANCDEIVTKAFIDKNFGGSVDACRQDAQNGDKADSVEVSSIDINGDAASAEATPKGGNGDGQAISMKLVKENGDWRIDEAALGGNANQLTDLFFQSVRDQVVAKGFSAQAADCIVGKLRSSLTQQELDALKAGDRPASVDKKATAAGQACGQQVPKG